MAELTYETLRDAVAGGAVALRSILRLQPADGEGGKVFPPTYAVRSGHRYAMEERLVDGEVRHTVLLDSVASQANRAELALLEGWESGELEFPVPFVDFTSEQIGADIGRVTVLEAPHRLADAIFRDSLLDGTLFRLSDIGKAITDARPRNATAMFRYAPSALLFGQWDSTGPKGGLGAKFQRSYVSEIVGHDAVVGKGVSSRIDPLQIERSSATLLEHKESDQVWTLDPAEAVQAGGKPKPLKKTGRPAEANHGNITPSFDVNADGAVIGGGVTISYAVQTTVISLAAIRRLRFADASREASLAARTAVAALGIAAIAYGYEVDFDLRSRCLLIPEGPPRVELVRRDGAEPEVIELDRRSSSALIERSAQEAAEAGLGWTTDEVRLVPAAKLIELLRRSREVSAREGETESE
ncbi:type I-U CRISPR-associated RAMP protein Csb1/Cas7u [Candidatus Poriferisodalis sp.]|uniref:type I-G CRISPR-associated RAMP protein Csb1/Cas7g n=1 Tax=Candidatus Poriferisodalis sp. TaxID=3101277 RepID=UPI003B0137B9